MQSLSVLSGISWLCVQYIPVGAEIEGIGADDIEELSDNEDDYYKLGGEDEEFKDYASLELKPDHANRCCPRLLYCPSILDIDRRTAT